MTTPYLEKAMGILGPRAWWLLIPIVGLPVAWYFLLPTPHPGVPYYEKAARRPWGDIPKMVKAGKDKSGIINFFSDMCADLNSPLVQLLANPFTKSQLLILSDIQEVEDILTRRTKEFDRLDGRKQSVNPVLREATVNMVSDDRFKAQRRLWAGVMTPEFVNKTASTHIRTSATNLLQLWRRKAQLAQERPFDAENDLRYESFDSIWGFSFGSELGSTKAQLAHQLEVSPESINIPHTYNEPVTLQPGDPPRLYTTIMKILSLFDDLNEAWLPAVNIWLTTRLSLSFRRAVREKDQQVAELVNNSRAAFEHKEMADEELATSAMDQVLRRLHNSKIESLTSHAKDPDQHLKDELFLFLIAGYETTATALSWIVKFLAAHQDVQARLRAELQSAFQGAKEPDAMPLVKAQTPYLEAVISEVLRCAIVAGGTLRVATTETSILGVPIPKDTAVLCLTNAQTYLHKKDIYAADEKRSESSKQYGGARGQSYHWPLEDRQQFKPSRWLRSEEVAREDGVVEHVDVYDDRLGPSMPFGMGPRGCFGKRLAWAKLRIDAALLVLNFEFLEVEGKGKDKQRKEFDLASFAGVDKVARQPQHTYVRLREL